jgi:beta-galactosidase
MRLFQPLFVGLLAAVIPLAAQPASSRAKVNFDAGWRFTRNDPTGVGESLRYAPTREILLAGAASPELVVKADPAATLGTNLPYTQPAFDDTAWRVLDLPHDWGIETDFSMANRDAGTGKLAWVGAAWYRKTFRLPAGFAGQHVYLDVDGAMAYANIWLNGHYAGGWPYGYSSFQVDLTPYLKADGDNVIAIRLNDPPNSSRWYPGGGLYRNVWLEAAGDVHVAHWGVYITTPEISPNSATVSVKVGVDNLAATGATAAVRTQIFAEDAAGRITGNAVASSGEQMVSLDPNGTQTAALTATVTSPKLWGLKTPNLYTAVTTVTQNGRAVDQVTNHFGIRTIKFDPNAGFFLNGEHVRLNGVCDHSDLGPLGSAINVRGLQRQIELLQSMGGNAIRTSHNPPSPELMDLCDRMGMLVMDETFDCWQRAKGDNQGYNILFADWHEKDTRMLVRRDRDHPSVILWSVGNEIPEQGSARGNEILAELTKIAHEEDPTRPTTTANNGGGFTGFSPAEYAYGFNYKPTQYTGYHGRNPATFIFGSETASTVSSYGFYLYPVSNTKGAGDAKGQVSSYDLYAPPWAQIPDTEFKGQDQNPEVGGEFVWTGFDYIGEPTGSTGQNPSDHSRSSYFGIMDLMGFKKDRFFLYQAHWRPDLPMAHLVPQNWNWPDRVGQVTPVHVYTSGDEAELFLNGQSLGRKKRGQFEYRIRFDDVVYQPGELKVVAYKNGAHWAEDTMKTTGAAANVTLTPDRATIQADGQDLSYVTVQVTDKDGLMVPTATNRVKFALTGPGEIVAVGNGDATSFLSFKGSEMDAFYGLALVVVRSKSGTPGAMTLTATADGLTTASVALTSR